MENNSKKILLQNLLNEFDIPAYKKKLNKSSLMWLSKNLIKKNKSNKYFEQALDLINFCLKERLYNS